MPKQRAGPSPPTSPLYLHPTNPLWPPGQGCMAWPGLSSVKQNPRVPGPGQGVFSRGLWVLQPLQPAMCGAGIPSSNKESLGRWGGEQMHGMSCPDSCFPRPLRPKSNHCSVLPPSCSKTRAGRRGQLGFSGPLVPQPL